MHRSVGVVSGPIADSATPPCEAAGTTPATETRNQIPMRLLSPIGPHRRAGGLSGPQTDAPHAQATRRRDPLGRPARLTDGTRVIRRTRQS